MKAEYERWIDDYVQRNKGSVLGRCSSATEEMVVSFPELKRVAGFVTTFFGEREHYWCETESGEVVDPTASQYQGVMGYRAWQPGDEVRVGKCMNCGEHIYRVVETLDGRRETVCSPECEVELVESFG